MATKIRFHLDEHISHTIAKALRQRGIDVTTTVEVGLRTRDDDAQLAYVRQERRVLVTNDADFLARTTKGEIHFGIVFYAVNSRSIGEIVTFLTLLYEIMSPDEIVNKVEYL